MSVATSLISPTIREGTNLRANLRANRALKFTLGKLIYFVEFLRGLVHGNLQSYPRQRS